ncbi:hypothetical protein [Synechococcus sp. PCC 7335]|uniref:hypothetical protein n=1 Tax=Synechococcus sp. (strain ATCC 29403 / PCC 7335) TaxID=91464 RepID=UPI0008FEC604|nr:hypothetical protein [Synechococcus sp. PCC 7335]
MKVQYLAALAAASVLGVTTVANLNTQSFANPCAAAEVSSDPCAADPCAAQADPCAASADPCAANPCAA